MSKQLTDEYWRCLGHACAAPCGQALFGVVTIAVGCGHVSGLLVQLFFTTAGPDVVREVGPDQRLGLDTRDPKKVLPPRRPTDEHHAISTSATSPLALALQSCAATAAFTHRQDSYPVSAAR